MDDHLRTEAAARAGITEEELTRLGDVGIFGILHLAEGDRYSSGDIRKAALIHSLTEAGLPLEGLA